MYKLLLLLALFISISLNPNLVTASDSLFAPPVYYSTEIKVIPQMSGMTTADINGDGNPDLVIASKGLSILHNSGDGTFSDSLIFNSIGQLMSVVASDLDQNSGVDLAAVGDYVYVLGNNEDGTILYLDKFEAGIFPHDITVADFDNDGDNDIAITTESTSTKVGRVLVFNNNGDGTFIDAVEYIGKSSPYLICSGDFDNDNDIDLAGTAVGLFVMSNRGDGTFTSGDEIKYFDIGRSPQDIEACDFDNDGDLDLFVSIGYDKNITICKNNGEADFSEIDSIALADRPGPICLSDFDGDKYPDLVITFRDKVSIMKNNGDGTFQGWLDIDESSPANICADDLDNDGDNDLMIAITGKDSVAVYLNQCNLE